MQQFPATAMQTHVVFDPDTGRVLGRVRHDASEPCGCADDDALLASYLPPGSEAKSLPRLREVTAAEDLPVGGRHRVAKDGRIVALPQLVVDPERTGLEGDGEDTIGVDVLAVSADGDVVDLSTKAQVTTTRGKLSTKRGMVTLKAGRASIRLTSTRETVEEVVLEAATLDGSAQRGTATVRFE